MSFRYKIGGFRQWSVIFICWLMTGLILGACNGEELEDDLGDSPESCDFTEKLVNIAIDEQRELLHDEARLQQELERLSDILTNEELQRLETEQLINEALPPGHPPHQEELSGKGKRTNVKIDLLQKLQQSQDIQKKEMTLTLYNHLRWGELVQDLVFIQDCDQRIVLKPEQQPYKKQEIERHFMDKSLKKIPKKNLYYAYSTVEEKEDLNSSKPLFHFTKQSTGVGSSTSFFLEDVRNGTVWKAKVGWSAYLAPLATHLAWGLGFYVDEVFHIRELRVKYDEVLIDLFAARNRDLEDSLAGIELEDGTRIDLVATTDHHPQVSALFHSHRNQIRNLVFKSALLERRNSHTLRAGRWSFDALRNYDLRAVRMLGLLQFWLNNTDLKFDNNRILIRCKEVSCDGDYDYHFTVHDLGNSFARYLKTLKNELDMRRDPDGLTSIRLLTDERDAYAWRLISHEDAVAFAERLALLTEEQLRQAVAAAGYPYPALVLLVEKLKARRNHFLKMVTGDRFAPLKANPKSVSSASSGNVKIGDENILIIPQDDFILKNGRLINDISLGKHGRHAEMVRK